MILVSLANVKFPDCNMVVQGEVLLSDVGLLCMAMIKMRYPSFTSIP